MEVSKINFLDSARVTLEYDGTFEGFLCCVHTIYQHKLKIESIVKRGEATQASLFSSPFVIETSDELAGFVWQDFQRTITKQGAQNVYLAFCSEVAGIEVLLLKYLHYLMSNSGKRAYKNVGNSSVLKVNQLIKMVGREKHRMEAFVRFKLTKDGVFFANVEPDFNVLPLVQKHFKKRYADQKWIIYDIKRNYGIYYDLNTVKNIEMNFIEAFDPTKTSLEIFDESEADYQKLWKSYFKSVNIESRKNTKLHLQHVPKRYWKYLSEKSA